MKRKGFTLIELLAVIVVLAIIALIATPLLIGIIENVKKNAFKNSILGIMEAGEIYIASNLESFNGEQIIFSCNGEQCYDLKGNNLSIKGNVPLEGQLIIKKDGTMISNYLTNGNYCVFGEKTNLTITKDCSDMVVIAPAIEKEDGTSSNGYYKIQIAHVKFNSQNIEFPKYFIKTTKKAMSSIKITEVCGGKEEPGECTTVDETDILNPNVWYRVNSDLDVTYLEHSNEEGYLYAITYDSLNYIPSNVAVIGKVDKNSPKLILDDINSTTNTTTISYERSDSESGIMETSCRCGVEENNYTTRAQSILSNNCTFRELDSNKTYFYQVCVLDRSENKVCETGSFKTN